MKAFPRGDGRHSSIADDKGMDLRDYFAAKAMQAMITNETLHSTTMQISHEVGLTEEAVLSEMAFVVADAMMEAREKK